MSARLVPRAVAFFLPSVIVLTVACGLVFVGLQQGLRQGADDPQVQLAEDLARRLDSGADPGSLVVGPTVDLATSLAPFEAVYDTTGRVIVTNGALDGGPPQPPIGVLDTARSAGVDRVTWQPRAGLRFALYVVRWNGGSVVAGRSLRLVEERTAQLQALIAIGWFVGLVLAAGVSVLAGRLVRSES